MKPVSIHIDKLYKNDLPSEDCKISVPFAKGILFEQDLPALRLLDPTSKAACPLQPFGESLVVDCFGIVFLCTR